jgi:hypothetical protein
MHRKVIIYILLALFTGFRSSYSQQEHKNSLIIGLRSHYGFIIAHHKELKATSQTYPWGLEAEVNWQLMTKESWQYCFCYPRVGFSFFYANFDNPDVLGSAFNLYGFMEPVIGAENKLSFSVKFGIGPNYMNKVYDSITNPDNTFYSSHISFIVLLGAGMNYRINDRLNIRLAGEFNHISNGGFKNPNKGINFPTINLGVDYNLKPLPFEQRIKDRSVDLIPKKNRFDVTFLSTAKTDIKGHAKYTVYGLVGSFSHVVGRLSAVSGGLEFVVDLADKHEIERVNLTENGDYVDHKYFAFLASHELLLGEFNFYQQLGVYLYSPFDRKDKVYQRYGLNFYLFKSFFIGINIKAHRHVADFMDMRGGYSF